MKPYPLLIGGVFKETAEIAKLRFPYTGDVYAEVCMAGNAELKEAVAAAVRGFQNRALPSHARFRILENLAGEIHARANELVDVMIMEGGKTRKFATNEVARAEMTNGLRQRSQSVSTGRLSRWTGAKTPQAGPGISGGFRSARCWHRSL